MAPSLPPDPDEIDGLILLGQYTGTIRPPTRWVYGS